MVAIPTVAAEATSGNNASLSLSLASFYENKGQTENVKFMPIERRKDTEYSLSMAFIESCVPRSAIKKRNDRKKKYFILKSRRG